MELWVTTVNLFAEGRNIKTDSINYLTSISQGDCIYTLSKVHADFITWSKYWKGKQK